MEKPKRATFTHAARACAEWRNVVKAGEKNHEIILHNISFVKRSLLKRIWCSGNIVLSQGTARGSIPRMRTKTFEFLPSKNA